MNRLALTGAVLALGLGLFALVHERPVAATAAAPTVRDAAPAALAPEEGPDAPGPLVTREESGEPVSLDTTEGGVLAQAHLPRLAREAAVREAARAAREGTLSPEELGRRLHDAAGNDPGIGAVILEQLVQEREPTTALRLAQALAPLLEDKELREAAVEALTTAGPEAREVGLLAFLGRGEPSVAGLANRSFAEDPPAARATAAFLLVNAWDKLASRDADAARATARKVLANTTAETRVREESYTLVARGEATPADVAALERGLLEDRSAPARGRAFLALVESSQPKARTRPVLERALADETLPEELKGAIRLELSRG